MMKWKTISWACPVSGSLRLVLCTLWLLLSLAETTPAQTQPSAPVQNPNLPAGQSPAPSDLPTPMPTFGTTSGRWFTPPPPGAAPLGTTTPIPVNPERARQEEAKRVEQLKQDRQRLKELVEKFRENPRLPDLGQQLRSLDLPWEDYLTLAEDASLDTEGHISSLRFAAMGAIREISVAKKYAALPRLIALMEASSEQLRQTPVPQRGTYNPRSTSSRRMLQTCVERVGEYGRYAESAVPALIRLLEAEDRTDQDQILTEVCKALGAIGRGASAAIPALERQAYRERSVGTCLMAYESLAKILLSNPDQETRVRPRSIAAFSGLGGLYAFAALEQDALPRAETLLVLEELLVSDPPIVEQMRALKLVAHLGPESPTMAAYLLDRLRSTDKYASYVVSEALHRFHPSRPEAIQVLAAGITDPNDGVCVASCHALARFGEEASVVLPTLQSELQRVSAQTNDQRFGSLLVLLCRLGPKGKALSPLLLSWLSKDAQVLQGRTGFKGKWLRAQMLYTLGEMGTPPAALPMILESLASDKSGAYWEFAGAAHAAAGLPEAAPQLVPLLLRAVQPDINSMGIIFSRYPIVPGFGHVPNYAVATSSGSEAILALGNIGSQQATVIVPKLQEFFDQRTAYLMRQSPWDKRPDLLKADQLLSSAEWAMEQLRQEQRE